MGATRVETRIDWQEIAELRMADLHGLAGSRGVSFCDHEAAKLVALSLLLDARRAAEMAARLRLYDVHR